MPAEMGQDPRSTLVREKYFSLRPKPLERWLWSAKAPGSAERVFWFHWDLGHQNGTWLSQVPIRVVADECGLDVATVTRAYQWLKQRGLLRRMDPGRDDRNPFQQATAVTEVFAPRELVEKLAATPNRRRSSVPVATAPTPAGAEASRPAHATRPPEAPSLSFKESQAVMQKLSDGERGRLYAAQRARTTEMAFDADSRLTPAEQAYVARSLFLVATARPTAARAPASSAGRAAPRTKLSVLQLVSARARIQKAKGEGDGRTVDQLLREVAWSVEQGSLAKFEAPHALSIACKTIREGRWSTPYRMPPDWQWRRALPEMCATAGQ